MRPGTGPGHRFAGAALAGIVLLVVGVPGTLLTLHFLLRGDTSHLGWIFGFDLTAVVCIAIIVRALRHRKTRRAVISADALGVWIGLRGRRVP